MAARSDAATDRVTLSSAPSMAAITIAGWAKIDAAAASSFNPILRVHTLAGDATSWILGFKGANGRTPAVYSPSNTSGISAAEQTLSTYVFLMATLSGTSAQLAYTNTPGGTLTKVTGTVAAAGTPDRLTFFGRSAADGSEWLNGTLAYWRIWLAVLSDAEGQAESASATPVRTANAWANWDYAAASLTDSVASRNLTAGSTALSSATDPTLGSPTEAGTATLNLGATGAQNRVATAAETSTATLGATGTQTRVATAASSAVLTLGATGTAGTLRAAAGTADLTLGATGSGSHVAVGTGAAALTLAADGTDTRVATGSGLAGLVLGGDGVALHVAAAAGTALLTLLATGTVDSGAAVDAGTALLTLGAAGVHTARRVAAGSAVLQLAATGTTPGDVVHIADEPRLTIRPNLAVLTLGANGATLTIDQGGT